MLLSKPLCVCELTHVLQLKTATVSNHLALLREKGFVVDEKEGKWINYKIVEQPQDNAVKKLLELIPLWFAEEAVVIRDLEKIKTVDRIQITCG